ncbi:MAG: hypothetical protein COA78_10445 [Blastopirellula sp.]|nr:MAG: hypothetical protein COA78_10445 [Blastopirellula sp.]
MNSGVKAAIAVVGIIVALFVAGAIGLVVLGALFVSTARVNIQQNAPASTVTTPARLQPNIQPGDVIMEVDGQKVTLPKITTPKLERGGELIIEVNGENLKFTPNISN